MGETTTNAGTPPQPKPPMGPRRPPGSTQAPSPSNLPSSMPPRKPQLLRRVNTSQGRRLVGRDPTNASDGGVRDRANSDGSQGGMRSEQIQSGNAHQRAATDFGLLLASLDKQAVEDEAESVRTISHTFIHTSLCKIAIIQVWHLFVIMVMQRDFFRRFWMCLNVAMLNLQLQILHLRRVIIIVGTARNMLPFFETLTRSIMGLRRPEI